MRNFIYLLSLLLLSLSACKKDNTAPENTDPSNTTPQLPAEYSALANIFEGDGVGAAFNLSEDIVVLFNVQGDRYAWFQDQEIKFTRDMDATDSHFAQAQFNRIGAISLYHDYRVYYFDEDGEFYSYFDFDNTEADQAWQDENAFEFFYDFYPLEVWGDDNTSPFVEIRSAWIYTFAGNDCFDPELEYGRIWMVGRDGDEVVRYASWSNFETEMDLEDWTAENNCGGPDGLIPFDAIGASCRLVRPNLIQELFFDLEGSKFCYYNVSEGIFSDIYELY